MSRERKRRSSTKPPAWVPDDALVRIGELLRDPTYAPLARTQGGWPETLDQLVGIVGGPIAKEDLKGAGSIDELVARYGASRVTVALLQAKAAPSVAWQYVNEFARGTERQPEETDAASFEDVTPTESAPAADAQAPRDGGDRHPESERLQRAVAEKDRRLREERAAHARTRSELTSERDKALHRVASLEEALAAGPDGETVERAYEAAQDADRRVEEARSGLADVERQLREARDRVEHLERLVERAARDHDALRAQLEAERRARAEERAAASAARPDAASLIAAARAIGEDAAGRIDDPAPGDEDLFAALAALARWSSTRSAAPAGRPNPNGAEPAATPAPPVRPVAVASVPALPAERPPNGHPGNGGHTIVRPALTATPTVTILGGGGIGESMYLVEHLGTKVLLDCGIGSSSRRVDVPDDLDALVITHAHGDHMGRLAQLVREQPDLRVYCSKATKKLAMFQANAVDEYIPSDHLLVRDPGETYRILDKRIELRLHRVAHCLGSCAVRLRYEDGFTLVYSGDLGGEGLRTLRPDDPLPLHGADVVLLESTLGDRASSRANWEEPLVREVAATIEGGGAAVFPASNLGRAQELAALLEAGFRSGELPAAPVLMTPLARRILGEYQHGDRSWLTDVPYPAAEALPAAPAAEITNAPCYVIAGGASGSERRSGALVAAAAARKEAGVFYTGFSGTAVRNRRRGDTHEVVLEDGTVDHVTITSRWIWIPSPDHASREELVAALDRLDRRVPVLLVHGAPAAKRSLSTALRAAGHEDVRSAANGNRFEIVMEQAVS